MNELIYLKKKNICKVIEEMINAISLKLKNKLIIQIKEKKNYLMLHHINTLCQTKYFNS